MAVLPEKKIDLHVHLDGAVSAETLWDIMNRRGMKHIATSLADLRHQVYAEEAHGTQAKLLSKFNTIVPIIKGDAEACRRIAYEYCKDSASGGVIYSELHYSPHVLASDSTKSGNHLTPEKVVQSVNRGLEEGQREFGVKVRSILCCLRVKPAWSPEVLALCDRFKDQGVVGIDIAGDERAAADNMHVEAFREAKRRGIHRTCHASDCGNMLNLKQALEEMHAERLGQGQLVLKDANIYYAIRIAKARTHLEVTPSSIRYVSTEPKSALDCIQQFLEDRISFSIGTDDPAILQVTLNDEYNYLMKNLGMTRTQLVKTNFDAAASSFLPENEKKELVELLERCYGSKRHFE